MGLAVRIIPTVLCNGRVLVKGEKFQPWRAVGLAEQAVRVHQARGVDELALLDVRATLDGRGPDLDLVRELAEGCFMPLAVGGGVKQNEDVQALLSAGADKVVIGEGACTLVWKASQRFGSQALVVSIDVDARGKVSWMGHAPTNVAPVAYAQKMETEGAGEILLTSIEREGTMQGYDLELIGAVSHAVNIPVIAHGGCSGYEDMAAAIKAGASAVAAGALFQFTEATPRAAAQALAKHGIEVRL